MTTVVPSATPAPEKRALLVGIDKYADTTFMQLKGCVNDVQVIQGILRDTFGFPATNITMLTDEQATQQGIRAAVESLIDAAGQGDIVAIHYSGHGSRVPDGPEADEPDGWDSTIVPHDSGRPPQPLRDITDDEIHVWLSRLTAKTPNVTLIFDSCHSGTITRDAFGSAARAVPQDDRARAEVQATLQSPTLDQATAAGLRLARSGADAGSSGWLPLGNSYLMIAGCTDREQSSEYDARDGTTTITHGALTYFLSKELLAATPGTTYQDIFERVSANVAANFIQHPQMEGTLNRLLFDTHDLVPMQFVPVVDVNSGLVTLGAGAAHGLTTGSRWAIYPQGTKQVAGETPLAQVEISVVRAVTSDARVVPVAPAVAPAATPGQVGAAGTSAALAPGCRAIEVTHAYGDMRLVVEVAAAPSGYEAAAASLQQALGQARSVRLRASDDPDTAVDLRIYVLAPRAQAGPGDPLPQLAQVAEASWAIVGRDGHLAAQPSTLLEADANVVSRNVETIAKYRNTLALTNRDPDSGLAGKVALTLQQLASDGTWQAAKPAPADGQIVYTDGDKFAFTITNQHTAPVYITMLDFGLSGGISIQIPPDGGTSQPFTPGHTVDSSQQGYTLELPERYIGDGGIETLKLMVTTQPADFTWLTQEGTRGIESVGTTLEQLVAMVAGGLGTRDMHSSTSDDWTTIERSFYLRRQGATGSR